MIIFVTGGVMSSLGKGITASALGALLVARGLKVRLRKFDPYLNVDPGTMSPYQHGEVFVTEDGTETDLDLGSYERFTGVDAKREDSATTGRLYLNVIEKERRGDFLGQTIQVIPHITDEIKQAMLWDRGSVDVIICEIGGTVGDIEGLPFLEAIRQLRHEMGPSQSVCVHLSWVPYFDVAGEFKTKLIQHSVRELQRCGIQPDVLVCRSDRSLPKDTIQKISQFCNVSADNVIEAINVKTIYETPLTYHKAGLDEAVCRVLGLGHSSPQLGAWEKIVSALSHFQRSIKIAMVGKYVRLPDTYRSLLEALVHGGLPTCTQVTVHMVDAEELETTDSVDEKLQGFDAIVVPGGFGVRGIEGMIKAITYARCHKIPFLGICLGLQLAVIEAARHLAGLSQASSSEFGPTPVPVIALLKEWMSQDTLHLHQEAMGGTMRLGASSCTLKEGSKIHAIYGATLISERHRHRYEVNGQYIDILEKAGVMISGTHKGLVECIERSDHPWFIATQFHPEFKSRPFQPHPLFQSFVEHAARLEEELEALP